MDETITVKRGIDELEDESIVKRLKTHNREPFDVSRRLKLKHETKVDKFCTTFSSYELNLEDMNIHNLPDAMNTVKDMFECVIDEVKAPLDSSDLVLLKFKSPSHDFPIKVPLTECSALTCDRVINQLEESIHYNTNFVLDKSLNVESTVIQLPKGGVTKTKPEVNLDAFLHDSKSVIRIRNRDNLCCARAIVTSRARIEKHPKLESIRKGYGIQKELAKELHQLAGVAEQQCGIEEIKKFQDVMPNYKISVISKECFNDFIYISPNDGIPIYLYLHDNHYDVITKITGFLNRSYFCEKCMKGHNHKEGHKCNRACKVCHRFHDDCVEVWTHCSECNRDFISDTCYRLHREKKVKGGKTTCDIWFKCVRCNDLINRSKRKTEHVCDEIYCRTCKGYFKNDHMCYMKVADLTSSGNTKTRQLYIFFEFQSCVDEIIQCKTGFVPDENSLCINCDNSTCGTVGYRPSLCVVQKVCTACMENDVKDNSKVCLNCRGNEKVFQGPDTTELFCKWLFSADNCGATVLCHNFKGFDSYPIVNYLHENGFPPQVIKAGSKYTTISVKKCKMRFLDSKNFLNMPLVELSKSFDENPLYDGFFPQLFNTKENQAVVLPCLPDTKYYNPDDMTVEMRKTFLSWYEAHRNDEFDFQKELIAFSESNVDLVRRCCLKFRSMFMAMSKTDERDGIDPFQKSVTIASACNLVYRARYLEPDTIALIPTHGYRPKDKQSMMAIQWLSYISHKKNICIRHRDNGGEKKIGRYKVDGFHRNLNGTRMVFEFNGDFWHGCAECYSCNTMNPVVRKPMGKLYKQTLEKRRYLERLGCVYESIWECEFVKEMKTNDEMREYIEGLELITPLEPKDAFYGGRTEGFKLFETTIDDDGEDKKIQYYDFTSLYPFINKNGKVPLGHPKIIKKDFKRLEKYEGLIKCKILPPDNLFIPVLPMKVNDKLVFGLCRTCSETYQQERCKHGDEARALIGTWVTDEVKAAVENGYQMLKIYEVWHFDRISQYDPVKKTKGVFTDYINTYLKLKQEASGWPDHCDSYEAKMKYIREYEQKEGILLDYDNIKKNPGLRALAKLMLNSFWGKFGQRSNLTQSMYVTKSDTYADMVKTRKQKVEDIHYVNKETIHVDWTYSDNYIENTSQTNVVIAAYTTAQARLKLFETLKRLGKRAIYTDTDSVVFVTRPGEWEPSTGDFLGEFKDEVTGNAITSFVTAGPKSYAYTLAHEDKDEIKSICKVKGLAHNFKNSLEVNYDALYTMITGNRSVTISVLDPYGVRRNPVNSEIVRKNLIKTFQFLFDKRVIVDKFNTVPYGYKT